MATIIPEWNYIGLISDATPASQHNCRGITLDTCSLIYMKTLKVMAIHHSTLSQGEGHMQLYDASASWEHASINSRVTAS